MPPKRHNQNRTAIVYFGASKQDYLNLINADERHQAYIAYIQAPLQAQISREQHQLCRARRWLRFLSGFAACEHNMQTNPFSSNVWTFSLTSG